MRMHGGRRRGFLADRWVGTSLQCAQHMPRTAGCSSLVEETTISLYVDRHTASRHLHSSLRPGLLDDTHQLEPKPVGRILVHHLWSKYST